MAAEAFFKIINNRNAFRLFLLRKLPAAFFAGLRIETASQAQCTVSVPYNWRTKNPFRSTYFACLSMAAEMSTGALAMAAVYGRKPPVSLLIVTMESRFFKKAVGKTHFTCIDGLLLAQAVQAAVETKQPQTVRVCSTGQDATGTTVATFEFTWSFKVKA